MKLAVWFVSPNFIVSRTKPQKTFPGMAESLLKSVISYKVTANPLQNVYTEAMLFIYSSIGY